MKRFLTLLAFILIGSGMIPALAQNTAQQDVIYLKNGAVFHGKALNVTPDTIQFQNNAGDINTYPMADVVKLQKAKVQPAPTMKPTPAPSATAVKAANTNKPLAPSYRGNSNIKFKKSALVLNLGGWGPGIITEINSDFPSGSTYDYGSVMPMGGIGFDFLTNGFGLKLNFNYSYESNNVSGSAFGHSGTIPTWLAIGGLELEGDFGLDDVQSPNDVMTFYLPVIVGAYYFDLNLDGYDWTNATTDFGLGVGLRTFTRDKFLLDLSVVYRWYYRGNYLQYNGTGSLPTGLGHAMDANMSGVGLNLGIGFTL